ncbi:hypothetical protein ACS0TY_034328 [Phlomoides rotata]
MDRNFSPQVSSIWRLAVVTIVWLVWGKRNRCLFDEVSAHPSRALALFWALIREADGYRIGCMHNSTFELSILSSFGIAGRPSKASSVICIRWQLPPLQFIKVNIDGGANGAPGRLSGGGVFRDYFGVFRGCFAVDHGTGFAFKAELATAFSAIEIAYEKGWLNLWLESDSTYVVNVLRNRQSIVPWRLLGRWHRIRRMLGDLQLVVSHIFREGNASADRLTREPVECFEWWNQVTSFLVPFLNRDRLYEFYRFTM